MEPPVLVTIQDYEEVNVAQEGSEPEMRWALGFAELDKKMVLNSTNGQIISQITKSEDFDGWIGVKVVLFNDANISFGGRLTGGIRVRAPRQPAAKPATPKPAPAPPKPEPVKGRNYEAQPNEPPDDDQVPFNRVDARPQ